MKKIVIIPGLGGKREDFDFILKKIEKKHKIVVVLPDWKKTLSELEKMKIEADIIIGYSLGALLAYRISTKKKIDGLFLCSMSSILEDDFINDVVDSVKSELGFNWYDDLVNKKYGESKASNIFSFYGKNEHPRMIRRAKMIGTSIVIDGCEHELNDKYLSRVLQELRHFI
ncbi:MAG: hypothetical protein WDZ73_01095 [Candidatus Paceibacterota bacterium]